MTGTPKRTERTRAYLDTLLQNCKPGTTLFTEDISVALSTKFRSVTSHNVGLALRERSDVELVSTGVWRKV
jgi:hypothetical protein